MIIKKKPANALKQLAVLYQIDLMYLYKLAGYFENIDDAADLYPFKNFEILNTEERAFIQHSIDFFAKNHNTSKKEAYHEI